MKRTPKKRIDYTGWTEEQHVEYLRTEPSYLAYYADFNPDTVADFTKGFGKAKYDMYQNEPRYRNHYEWYETRFLSGADYYIFQILQKKLFNLQCQWRAGLIELPLVDIIADFTYWSDGDHIRSCPFIAPITEEEIDLCLRFLKEKIDWTHDSYMEKVWQDYDKFKNQLYVEAHKGEPEAKKYIGWDCADLPGLYVFFDAHQNTGHLIDLPNIRGEKEDDFRSKGWFIGYEKRVGESKEAGTYQEHESEKVGEEGNAVPYVRKPNLYGFVPDAFIEAVEDEHTKTLFKQYKHYTNPGDNLNYDGLDEDLQFLKEFDEPIPVLPFDDWRIAVRVATYKFKQKKAAEMLPYAYDSYLLAFDDIEDVETVIAHRVARYKFEEKDHAYRMLQYYKEEFLDGREALTGKRDFDYLND